MVVPLAVVSSLGGLKILATVKAISRSVATAIARQVGLAAAGIVVIPDLVMMVTAISRTMRALVRGMDTSEKFPNEDDLAPVVATCVTLGSMRRLVGTQPMSRWHCGAGARKSVALTA